MRKNCPRCGTKVKKKWNGSRCKKCGYVNILGKHNNDFMTARQLYGKRAIVND